MGYCERYRVPHGAGPLQGAVASVRPRAARARARLCDGTYEHTQGCLRTPTGRGGRTQAHSAASRAGRAHRRVSKLNADSAAGIVPSSEFNSKSLPRACFVPLCSEMLMQRSVPRTHTSPARGGRMGPRPSGYWTRILEGVLNACPPRARATRGTPAMPQCAHTFHSTWTDTRKLTSDSHAPTRAARVRARRRNGALARCSHPRPHGAHWASTHVPRHGTARRRR
jgi:hypothetical protein